MWQVIAFSTCPLSFLNLRPIALLLGSASYEHTQFVTCGLNAFSAALNVQF